MGFVLLLLSFHLVSCPYPTTFHVRYNYPKINSNQKSNGELTFRPQSVAFIRNNTDRQETRGSKYDSQNMIVCFFFDSQNMIVCFFLSVCVISDEGHRLWPKRQFSVTLLVGIWDNCTLSLCPNREFLFANTFHVVDIISIEQVHNYCTCTYVLYIKRIV